MRERYLEINLPQYLQKSLDDYIEGERTNSSLWDCYFCDLQASINIAEVDQDISASHASYLRKTFLYDEDPQWEL